MEFLKLPQIDMDALNDTLRTSHICGETVWIVNTWKKFWAGVESGELSLNPKVLFSKRKKVIGEYVN